MIRCPRRVPVPSRKSRTSRLAFARAELTGDGSVLLGHLLELATPERDETVEFLELDLAIAIELSELFDLALGGVRLALGSAPRKLLARPFDLNPHLAELAD